MNIILKIITLVACFMWMVGCSNLASHGKKNRAGYTESGKASFYADKHEQRKTANGEIYKHSLNTAAHKNLPFGAKVKVTNLENQKTVVVKVNDRGPFVKGRIIDLSKSAFAAIGNTSSGVVNVKIEVIN
jgi:rare lipoprotein A